MKRKNYCSVTHILVICGLALIMSSSVHAQHFEERTVLEDLVDSYVGIMEGREHVRKIGAAAGRARADYWEAYASGHATQALYDRYQEKLAAKDLLCAAMMQASGADKTLRDMMGPMPDGGIHPHCMDSFTHWAGRFMFEVKNASGGDPASARRAAARATETEYLAYLADRQAAEYLFRSGLDPLDSEYHSEMIPAVLLRVGSYRTLRSAQIAYASMHKHFGEAAVANAAHTLSALRVTEKQNGGNIIERLYGTQLKEALGDPGCFDPNGFAMLIGNRYIELGESAVDFEVRSSCGMVTGPTLAAITRARLLRQDYGTPTVFEDAMGSRFIAGRDSSQDNKLVVMSISPEIQSEYRELQARQAGRSSREQDQEMEAFYSRFPEYRLAAEEYGRNGHWFIMGTEGYLPLASHLWHQTDLVPPLFEEANEASIQRAAEYFSELESQSRERRQEGVRDGVPKYGMTWQRPREWGNVRAIRTFAKYSLDNLLVDIHYPKLGEPDPALLNGDGSSAQEHFESNGMRVSYFEYKNGRAQAYFRAGGQYVWMTLIATGPSADSSMADFRRIVDTFEWTPSDSIGPELHRPKEAGSNDLREKRREQRRRRSGG